MCFRTLMILSLNFAPINSDFEHIFLDNIFFFHFFNSLNSKGILQENRQVTVLVEDKLLFYFSGKVCVIGNPPCCQCACVMNARALMKQEFVHSKDVPCNTEESP